MPFYLPPNVVQTYAGPTDALREAAAMNQVMTLLAAKNVDGTINMDHPFTLAFNQNGINDMGDLMSLTPNDIDGIMYLDPNNIVPPGAQLTVVNLSLANRQRLKIIIQMYNMWTHHVGSLIDITTIDMNTFNEWRIRGYMPNLPLQVAVGTDLTINAVNIVPLGAPPAPGNPPHGGGHHHHGPSRAEQFNRGIKKDKDHYPEFKDEKGWDNFRRSVETTARTHGTRHSQRYFCSHTR